MIRCTAVIALAAGALGGCGGGGPAVDSRKLERELSGAFYPDVVDLREPAKFECQLPEGDGIEDRWACVGRTQVAPKVRPGLPGITPPPERGVVIEMDVWVNANGYFAGVQTAGTEIGPSDTDIPPEGAFGYLGTDQRP